MTGAPMPAGADAVVMVEDTEPLDGGRRVRIGAAVGAGDAVRRRRRRRARRRRGVPGRHRAARRPSLGVLASVGRADGARSSPRPRVGVLSTGDELVEDGGAAAPGPDPRVQPARCCSALVAEAGCDAGRPRPGPRRRGRARRRRRSDAAAAATPSSPAAASAWATSTSSRRCSTGIADMRWMQIAIKPAKPFAFGLLARRRPRRAGVRPARQPGLVAGQLRAVRPPGAAPDDGPRRPSTARRVRGRRRRRAAAAVPTARLHLYAGHRPVRATTAAATSARPARQGSHQLAATAAANGLAVRARRRRRRAGRRRRRPAPGVTDVGVSPAGSLAVGCARWTSSTPSGAPSATCASRSPTAATSAAPTACRRRAWSGCPASEVLTFEEIERLARVFVERFGVDGIRLTGGEPTVRAHLPVLVEKLAAAAAPSPTRRSDLSITTNGATLRPASPTSCAPPGSTASTSRSTRCGRDRFVEMTRRDELDRVLDGIDAAHGGRASTRSRSTSSCSAASTTTRSSTSPTFGRDHGVAGPLHRVHAARRHRRLAGVDRSSARTRSSPRIDAVLPARAGAGAGRGAGRPLALPRRRAATVGVIPRSPSRSAATATGSASPPTASSAPACSPPTSSTCGPCCAAARPTTTLAAEIEPGGRHASGPATRSARSTSSARPAR